MSSTDLEFEASFLNGRVVVLVGDITRQDVSAIVNAANSTLLGGGGVDGAIHREGGPSILKECREIRRTRYPNGLPTGEAVLTTGGNLPARFVIHTVGPIYGRNKDDDAILLATCYENSLLIASRISSQPSPFLRFRQVPSAILETKLLPFPLEQSQIHLLDGRPSSRFVWCSFSQGTPGYFCNIRSSSRLSHFVAARNNITCTV